MHRINITPIQFSYQINHLFLLDQIFDSTIYVTKVRLRYFHQLVLKLSRVRGKRNKKLWFRDNFSHFQIFDTVRNLEI